MNIKKLALIAAAISIGSLSEAMIKLPDAQTIKERLKKNDLQHFLSNTQIETKLGGTTKSPEDVVKEVDNSIANYIQLMVNNPGLPMIKTQLDQGRTPMIEAILKDHPASIEQLKEEGLLDATNNDPILRGLLAAYDASSGKR